VDINQLESRKEVE